MSMPVRHWRAAGLALRLSKRPGFVGKQLGHMTGDTSSRRGGTVARIPSQPLCELPAHSMELCLWDLGAAAAEVLLAVPSTHVNNSHAVKGHHVIQLLAPALLWQG